MAELDISLPTTLGPTSDLGSMLIGIVEPADIACYQLGTATFNWLLRFDTAASTLEIGGAKPVADPTAGYAFVSQTIQGTVVAPATFTNVKPDAAGKFDTGATGQDLVVPIYLDTAGTQALLIPLRAAKITNATLSSSQGCIGSYNANRDPANECFADETHPAYINGGDVSGLISLEDADKIEITSLAVTLCVALTGTTGVPDPGTGAFNVCERDTSNKIVPQGDACLAGGTGCNDAFAFTAKFAASSIKIN
jgi:hypothetical protein